MPKTDLQHTVSPDVGAYLAKPRQDFLVETETSPGVFIQESGPFSTYQRNLVVTSAPGGRLLAHETIDFKLAMPVWAILFNPLMKRGLSELDRTPKLRRWWPREVLSERSTTLISFLAVLSVIGGYLGVAIGQTISLAAVEFGVDDSGEANTLAAIRIGVVLSALVIGKADKIGRRPLLLSFAFAAIIFTATGALATDMLTLGISQALARGFGTGLLTLLALSVAEEVPASVRSLSVALMSMATGFGAALLLLVLPTADISEGSWRIVFALALVFLPVLWWVYKHLPETQRFDIAIKHHTSGSVNRRRFVLLATSAFCSSLFLSPASQLQNSFLIDERGFSALDITVFRLVVSTPVAIVFLVAGYFADRYGRKKIGSMGLALGSMMALSSYHYTGVPLWLGSMASVWALGASFTALRGYQTELFPTAARARIGGFLDVIAVSGSALGLVVVGRLSVYWGSMAPALLMVSWAPLLVALMVWRLYPETAAQELEMFNPDDVPIKKRSLKVQ